MVEDAGTSDGITADDQDDDSWFDDESEDEGDEFEDDEGSGDFAVQVNTYIDGGDWKSFFELFEKQGTNITSRLDELDDNASAGAGNAVDSLAEQDPAWFIDNIKLFCSPIVQAAVLGRPRISAAVKGATFVPPQQIAPDTEQLGPPPDMALPPVPGTEQSASQSGPSPLDRSHALALLNSQNLEGFFSELVESPANLSVLADDEVGAAFDAVAEAYPDIFEQWATWLCAQPGFSDARNVIGGRAAIQRLGVLSKGKERERPQETWVSEESQAISDSLSHSDLNGFFNYLLVQPERAAGIVADLHDPTAKLLDDIATQHAAEFLAWFDWCNNLDVQTALLSRPAISNAIQRARYPEFVAPIRPTAPSETRSRPPKARKESEFNQALRKDEERDQEQSQWEAQENEERDWESSAEEMANYVQKATEYLQSVGDTSADDAARILQFGEMLDWLASMLSQRVAFDRQTALAEAWWKELEVRAGEDPDQFAQLVARRGAKLAEFLSIRPVLTAIVRSARRSAQAVVLTDALRYQVAQVNERYVKDVLENGQSTTWTVGGGLVLIGDRHDSEALGYVSLQPDRADGQVRIRKGGRFRTGALYFSGCPLAKQQLVTSAVAEFSAKKAVFDDVGVQRLPTATIRRRGRR